MTLIEKLLSIPAVEQTTDIVCCRCKYEIQVGQTFAAEGKAYLHVPTCPPRKERRARRRV